MCRTRLNPAMGMLIALTLLGASAVSSNPDRLTIGDVFNLELVTDPQISPDGSRIVYVRQCADITSDQRRANLWSSTSMVPGTGR